MDNRDKMRLMAPDRAYVKNNPWTYQKTCDGSEFEKSVR